MADAKNAVYTKEYNRAQILRLLRQQPVSRAELARLTGLTRAAISLIVEELMHEGFVKESAAVAENRARGRMPVLLKLCADAKYAVGVRLTRRDCRVGLCDFRGRVIARDCLPLPKNPESLMTPLADAVQRLVSACHIAPRKLLGVGVAAPGPVDGSGGIILNPPDFDDYHGFPIANRLSKALGLPVWLENDANAEALHNYMDGQFSGKENFLLLMVDSGVGSGVIWRGKLLHACELGHTSIDYRGPRCACGNRGCLETYASIPRMLKRFPTHSSWESLLASDDGDSALKLQADFLAAAIINAANLLPVETVLLSGQLRSCAHRLAPMIRSSLQGRALLLGKREVLIQPALDTPDGDLQASCSIAIGRYLQI